MNDRGVEARWRWGAGAALVVAAAMVAGGGRAASERFGAIYDQPIATATGTLPPGAVEEGGGLTCFSYPQFVVKEIDSGGPGGDVSITIVPAGARGGCSAAAAAGQIVVKTEGQSFAGVKGDFIVLELTDPTGASAFTVLDRRSGRVRYSDGLMAMRAGEGLLSIADENDVLHLRYTRGINGSCSLPKGGAACFAQIAREARLPVSVGMDRAGLDACASVYRSLKVPVDDPSIVTYVAEVLVPRAGRVQVVSRSGVGCYPAP